MKRMYVLTACISFFGATMVQAETIWVSVNRTSYDSSWDEADVHLRGFSGADVPHGDVIGELIGTWFANGGTFNLPGSGNWKNTINNLDDVTPGASGDLPDSGNPAPDTWVNMHNLTPDTPARYKADGTYGGDTNSQKFYAGWYMHLAGLDGIPVFALSSTDLTPGDNLYYNAANNDTEEMPGYGFDNTLVGRFLISKSTTWANGETIGMMDVAGFGSPVGGGPIPLENVPVVMVPEPSTIALLGCGLFGLLAYAWRKRK